MDTPITSAQAFGSRVRAHRKRLNMTQRELALATNVGERFIVNLEQGKETCQLGTALRIAKAVGLRLVECGADRPGGAGGYDLDLSR